MKVSVIIPTYKPSDYLFECLDSIAVQTVAQKEIEILIILNGCNEPYFQQIKNYSQHHEGNHIRIFQTNQPGVSNARNIGLDHAQGDYICFIDDDDWISKQYLEELLSSASAEVLSLSNFLQMNEEGKCVPHFLTDAYKNNINKKNTNTFQLRSFYSSVCGKLIPRGAIGKTRFDNQFRLGEDSLFMFAISKRIHKEKLARPDAIYYIRQRSGSASRQAILFKDKAPILLKLLKAYIGIWLQSPLQYNFLFFLSRLVATFTKFFIKNYR